MSVVLCDFSVAVLDTRIFLTFALTLNHNQKKHRKLPCFLFGKIRLNIVYLNSTHTLCFEIH